MNEREEFFGHMVAGEGDATAAALLALKLGGAFSAREVWEIMGNEWTGEMEAAADEVAASATFFPGRNG